MVQYLLKNEHLQDNVHTSTDIPVLNVHFKPSEKSKINWIASEELPKQYKINRCNNELETISLLKTDTEDVPTS